jgi:tetratricopeptide (TPR) repeat protein
MSKIDLHPEDLLDRERDGTLTDRERALLEAHVERCAVCRLEREAASELSRAMGPRPDDVAVLERVIERIAPGPAAAARRRSHRWVWFAAAAAVLLLTTTVAAGELWPLARAWLVGLVREDGGAPAPSIRAIEEPRLGPAHRAKRPRAARDVPPPPAELEQAPVVEAVEPGPAPRVRPSPRGRPVEVEASPLPPAEPPAARQPVPTAAELLVQANAERSRGNLGEAARLYRELSRLHPGSREEVTSRVSLGRLLLEGPGAPGEALRLFDGYLAASPGGNLDEEARFGRARCLERLGRPADEARAWESLLEHHPGSVHASRARSRIDVIRRERADDGGERTAP